MAALRITQVRSQIGETARHRGTLRALGLGKIGRSVEHPESPQLAGMLRKVRHLVRVEKARSGSAKMRAGFEGGQMPVYMRLGKQRGSTSKDAMPVGPHRTYTVPVNVRDLDRFDDGAEVTLETLVEKRLIKNTKTDVKLLSVGDVTKKLSVRVHAISATAREKIEAAGGTVERLKE